MRSPLPVLGVDAGGTRRILYLASGGLHPTGRLLSAYLKRQSRAAIHRKGKWIARLRLMLIWNMVSSSFQREMTALLTQGRVAFGNLGIAPTGPIAHL